MFVAALFTIAKTWKQPECQPTHDKRRRGSVQFSSVVSDSL